MLDNETEKMVDLKDVKDIEILIIDNKLWINIDGKCRLRVYGFNKFEVKD